MTNAFYGNNAKMT